MTLEQVKGFLDYKIKHGFPSTDLLKDTRDALDNFEKKGYDINIDDGSVIVSKDGTNITTFEFGGLKEIIESEYWKKIVRG